MYIRETIGETEWYYLRKKFVSGKLFYIRAGNPPGDNNFGKMECLSLATFYPQPHSLFRQPCEHLWRNSTHAKCEV